MVIIYNDVSQKKQEVYQAYFAMLHDVQLSKPCLIKGVTSRVYNMTKSVLFRQHEHRIEETLHRIC